MKKQYSFTETHEHPEGGDRGGFAPETHSFIFDGDKAVHEYELGCNDSGPGGFGLDNGTLQRLTTRVDALGFVKSEVDGLKAKLAEAEECFDRLSKASVYEDQAEYFGYGDEEEEEG